MHQSVECDGAACIRLLNRAQPTYWCFTSSYTDTRSKHLRTPRRTASLYIYVHHSDHRPPPKCIIAQYSICIFSCVVCVYLTLTIHISCLILYIYHICSTTAHTCNTCKMLSSKDLWWRAFYTRAQKIRQ